MYSTLQDKVLISSIKKGKTGAFQELYERYWESLYIHAKAMTSCDDTAKDIVQEIFVELWDDREELNIHISLKAYLFRTVRNRVLNTYARNQIHEKYLLSLTHSHQSEENQTDYLLRENLLQERISKEISALPAKMQQIFVMSRKENKTYKEIAEELNISDKTVKKQVSNALKILKSKLEFVINALLLVALSGLF